MMMSARFVLIALALAGTAACSRQPQSSVPANTVLGPGTYVEQQGAYLNTLAPAQGWQGTPSGLRYRKVGGPGTGAHPRPTDTVTLHYVGTLTDGTEFDSSRRGGQPVTFPLQDLVRGWQEGVPLMGVGDTYEFAIPSDLGYGPMGQGPIPGGATLLFTIELIAIVPPGQQPTR
jgi:FKBP-type peptidyl-prolyl cis-trans isomerase FkpA